MYSRNKKGQLEFIRVIFVAFAFLIIFAIGLVAFASESSEFFVNMWGSEYPILSWIIGTVPVWMFFGGFIAVVGALVWGISLWQE